MMRVEVRDHAVWIKHIDGPDSTLEWLSAMPAETTVRFVVDDVTGVWRKMTDGKDGRPTAGFRPDDEPTRAHWHELQARRGTRVSLLVHAGE